MTSRPGGSLSALPPSRHTALGPHLWHRADGPGPRSSSWGRRRPEPQGGGWARSSTSPEPRGQPPRCGHRRVSPPGSDPRATSPGVRTAWAHGAGGESRAGRSPRVPALRAAGQPGPQGAPLRAPSARAPPAHLPGPPRSPSSALPSTRQNPGFVQESGVCRAGFASGPAQVRAL